MLTCGPGPLAKCPTGIAGLDEITFGGLPHGRPTLICGGAGSGKTLLALQFLINGSRLQGEPGVMLSFEESAEELAQNVASLGVDLPQLEASGLFWAEHIDLEPGQADEAGSYDLDGLFLRLELAVSRIRARRVVLDGIENLFSAFASERTLRSELQRLFRWLKEHELSAVVTAERGTSTLTRQGLEEYLSDCVILLDQRFDGQVGTRRLRVVKYRGSAHGSNEYPFLLDSGGFTVLPVTSLGLAHQVSSERISSGVASLDEMLGGGFYRGSTVLVSGTGGTGKSSLAAHFSDASCRRGERCLVVALEESPAQIMRNMTSIGIDLAPWHQSGLLRFVATRPTSAGPEAHLTMLYRLVSEFKPQAVVIDPISAFETGADRDTVKIMLMRVVDLLKRSQTTGLFTNLSLGHDPGEATTIGISSLVDTWLLLRNLELAGERSRGLYIIKSRGMAHSNQIREFCLTSHGVQLLDVRLAEDGTILTGSARAYDELREREQVASRRAAIARRRAGLERRRRTVAAQIEALQADFEEDQRQLENELEEEERRHRLATGALQIAASRRNRGLVPGAEPGDEPGGEPGG